jgi:hypothetical protein
MTKKKKDDDEVLAEIYDKIWDQFAEDRASIKEVYEDIKTLSAGNPERLVMLGDNLTKCAELLTKQTSQIIELLKVAEKRREKEPEDNRLSKDDLEEIYKHVGDKHQ